MAECRGCRACFAKVLAMSVLCPSCSLVPGLVSQGRPLRLQVKNSPMQRIWSEISWINWRGHIQCTDISFEGVASPLHACVDSMCEGGVSVGSPGLMILL